MKRDGNYYLGLDIGTDSVGYAVTDMQYNLCKFKGEPAWGVTIFDAGKLNGERRGFRSDRRRLDRRRQRVALVQELFTQEISKQDPRFFIRLQESSLYRSEVDDVYPLFCDENYTDRDYYQQYPTIHHLIVELMESRAPHDVRLVYLACAWLVAHRGHFFSNLDKDNLANIKDFQDVYGQFLAYFRDNGFDAPWNVDESEKLGDILQENGTVTEKNKALVRLLYQGKKPPKTAEETFPFSKVAIVKLLAGGTVKLKDLYQDESYGEAGSVSLQLDDEQFNALAGDLGEDFDLLAAMRALYDWALLVNVLGPYASISEAKVAVYEQHKADLQQLKRFVKKYIPEQYHDIFRAVGKANYTAYAYHSEKPKKCETLGKGTGAKKEKKDEKESRLKKASQEDFCKYLLACFKAVSPAPEDAAAFAELKRRLEQRDFLPKQKTSENRVIPHQLYWSELDTILKNAETYLPALAQKDNDGLTVSDKIRSIFLFRIPYFVGPLNPHSDYAWLERKAGKIYPWNFETMVDLDASEQNFIQRMTNSCTYLPGESVLPKCSLAYQKFMVLNEINTIKINGQRISVDLKQQLYTDLFLRDKKVTQKKLIDFLVANGVVGKGEDASVTGLDLQIHGSLSSAIGFRQLLQSGRLTEADVEKIIERASYAEDKSRLAKWLSQVYPDLSEQDQKYICSLKLKEFGKLSRKFLCELEGADKATGEKFTILRALWETQCNLMELLSDAYTFREAIVSMRNAYYEIHARTLAERLDEMYVSNTVKRQIYRTLDVVKDVTKAFGTPQKIFIEMTRGGSKDQKGKRTLSRKQQILELYAKCNEEDVRLLRQQLEDLGEAADSKLQGDKLFLYYLQMGKCMYTGQPIDLANLGSKQYDIDHIYPQALVKDDSIINNKVLCCSSANGEKSNHYPIKESIRRERGSYWEYLRRNGLISEEKYKRLIRATPFTAEEKWGFINRQLTETSQSTKAVATLLKEYYPETELIYCKAGLVSDFRREFKLEKSRTFNDLHHAVDAYLNIVTGNVYHMKFSKQWFRVDSEYSLKTKTLFTWPQICNGVTIWEGEAMLQKVIKTAKKNHGHFTKYACFKRGGFFDQQPVAAAKGLVPRKKGLPTEKYGGYNKAGVMFFIPVKYKIGKKTEVIIMSVELLFGARFLSDNDFAQAYTSDRLRQILGKPVDEISFPLGMRPWKVNTVLSLDGFRVCISGSSSGGKCLVAQSMMQFSAEPFWQFYIKKLESFVEKMEKNPAYIYDEVYDKISKTKNAELYDLCLNKLEHSIYAKRINTPVKILQDGKQQFLALDIQAQAKALLNIHQIFGRIAGGCDLSAIGGGSKAAATSNFSSSISNWKKNYSEVRIIDASPSGLWEKQSENILELL